jgi:arylformamidase
VPGSEALAGLWSEMAATWRDAMEDRRARMRLDIRYGEDPRARSTSSCRTGAPRASLSSSTAATGSGWGNPSSPTWRRVRAVMAGRWRCPATRKRPRQGYPRSRAVATAIAAAADEIAGPIRLAGHSAGGHLVARMACTDSPPARPGRDADRTGALDQRHPRPAPLRLSEMNAVLKLDEDEATAESPALLDPRPTLSFHAVSARPNAPN